MLNWSGVALVQLVEPTGSETQVLFRLGETQFSGAFRERVMTRPGEMLRVAADPALVHLFDKATGQRI